MKHGAGMPAAGDVLDGKLEIVRLLGEGGMGAVFEATNQRTGRRVAVKMLRAHLATDADLARRFVNEALAGGRVQHPNVVDIYDAGVSDGRPYLVMELLAGESLADRVKRTGPLAPADAVRIVAQAARGVMAAHAAGIVHRDLKPENVFLAREGDHEVTKVLDFGISKFQEADGEDSGASTRTGTVLGTPHYMSVEQARGLRDVDARTDVYALGAVLYHVLTGRPPFVGDNYNAILAAILIETPVPPSALRPGIPPALDRATLHALEKVRESRPPTVQAFVRELESSIDDAGSAPTMHAGTAPPASLPAKTPAPRPAGRLRTWIALGMIAVAGAASVWAWSHASTQRATTTPAAAPLPPMDAHRVAVIATREGTGDPERARAFASRIIEEIDRYEDFHPVAPAGLLAASTVVLGDDARLPTDVQAGEMARRVGAATVVALPIHDREGGISVSVHVFATEDLARGASEPPEHLSAAELDGEGPGRVAQRVADALERFLGHPLVRTADPAEDAALPFASYEDYTRGVELFTLGDYEGSVAVLRSAIARSPDSPAYESQLVCALSYRDAPGDAEEAERLMTSLRGRVGSIRNRRLQLVTRQDLDFVEGAQLKESGHAAEARVAGQRALASDLALAYEYQDPIGFLYGAATYQYLLDDVPSARRMYREVRERAPTLYPAYYEEAKLLRGDGRNAANSAAAARILWTYIRCVPKSSTLPHAQATVAAWHLREPANIVCPAGTARAE